MPTSSIDTFFACTIILAAALISTVYVGSTLQLQINNSQDIDKQDYLKALSNSIIFSPGMPADWAISDIVPGSFGLAASPSQNYAEVDINKINRIGDSSLSYPELVTSTNLRNLAFGIKVSPLLDIKVQQLSNSTINHLSTIAFAITTSLNSKPTSASLHAYAKATSFQTDMTSSTSQNGTCILSIKIPETNIDGSLLIIFAQATVDKRMTSFAVYNFDHSAQESCPDQSFLAIDGPINNQLTWTSNSSLIIQGLEVFSYTNSQNVSIAQGTSYCMLPNIVESSPQIAVLNGNLNGKVFQVWTDNPRVPLEFGSSFSQSEQNVYASLILVDGILCKIEISVGDIQ